MVPAAANARLHYVGSQIVAAAAQRLHLRCSGHHPAKCRQPGPKHVGNEYHFSFLADRTAHLGGSTEVRCSPDELRMGIAHLILAKTAPTEFIDEVPAGKAVVYHCAA